ncbi:MAG TPA: hypothetical protein VF163_03215 [Micromonosporaceae bacterium]
MRVPSVVITHTMSAQPWGQPAATACPDSISRIGRADSTVSFSSASAVRTSMRGLPQASYGIPGRT